MSFTFLHGLGKECPLLNAWSCHIMLLCFLEFFVVLVIFRIRLFNVPISFKCKDAKWKVNTPHCVLRVSWASRMAWNWWSSEAKPCRRPRREPLSTGLEIYGDSINSFNSAVLEFLLCSFIFFSLKLDGHVSFFGVSMWGPVAKSSWCSQWQESKRQSLIRFARRQQQRRCIWRRFTDCDCCRERNLCRESLYFLASWIGRMIRTNYKQMIWNKLLRHQHERD